MTDPEEQLRRLVQASGKLTLLDKMLRRLREQGHRVLIFSQFSMLLDILQIYLELSDTPFCRLDGDVSQVERQERIDQFNGTHWAEK